MRHVIIFNLFAWIPNFLSVPIINFSNDTNLIHGGQNAKHGQFPHQVSILYEGSHSCGGSIIDKYWVLTAVHCLENDLNLDNYEISAGNILYSDGAKYRIEKYIPHENYSAIPINDVALLKIRGDGFDFNNSQKINKIDLMLHEIPIGANIIISGWGINNHWQIPDQLQFAEKLINEKVNICSKLYDLEELKDILCLKHVPGIGACQGDSGGPAHYNGKLAGVASFVYSVGCATDKPDVYTKVSSYSEWIYNKMFEN